MYQIDNICRGTYLTASRIAEILEYLEDGKWHSLREMQQKIKLEEDKIQQVIAFLVEYGLIMVDEKGEKVKLKRVAQRFLTQTIP